MLVYDINDLKLEGMNYIRKVVQKSCDDHREQDADVFHGTVSKAVKDRCGYRDDAGCDRNHRGNYDKRVGDFHGIGDRDFYRA